MSDDSRSICFVAHELYSFFEQGEREYAGGAERQQYLYCEELSKRGYDVSAIVGDFGQSSPKDIDGIDIYKSYQSWSSEFGFFHLPVKILKLLNAMYSVNADVYYTRTPHYYLPIIIFSILMRKKSIISISNNSDIQPQLTSITDIFFTYLNVLSLKFATHVLSQTSEQKERLKSYNIDSIIVPNGYPSSNTGRAPKEDRDGFLWVGRADREQKHPERYLTLADKLPDLTFKLILSPTDNTEFFNEIKKRTIQTQNVEFIGFVQPNNIDTYYRDAIALINTSDSEGFPNTFLEAWRHGTPVCSLYFDPDNLLEDNAIGSFSGSMEQLRTDSLKYYEDDELWREESMDAKGFFEQNFSIIKTIDKLENVIIDD